MKRETRTHIVDPDDAIRAAFQLFGSILAEPDAFPMELDGGTFRPVERVEEHFQNGRVSGSVSFEVTIKRERKGEATVDLPEMQRVLIEA